MIVCPKCGQEKEPDTRNPHLCVDCSRAETNRYNYLRRHQDDWMTAAKDAGVDPWLQQPGETQFEYTVWSYYRDSYPGRKPTYAKVAEQAGTTVETVKKVAQRWTFPARMQAWMTECDKITMLQRRQEILEMNAEHINMAARLRSKLSAAIDAVDPLTLKPSDLSSLMRIATDLERKARVDEMAHDEMLRELSHDVDNPSLKKSPTKSGDLSEVVQILLNAGALGSVTQIGIRETTTREVVARSDDGSEARLIEE